jgi:hypothetical protein
MNDVLNDSIETSLTLNLYPDYNSSQEAHTAATLEYLPLHTFNDVNNFNPDRLQSSATKAYPKGNRPRGSKDIKSVNYLVDQLKGGSHTKPIYLHKSGNEYTLLDGAHRVIAHHIAKKEGVLAYVVQ